MSGETTGTETPGTPTTQEATPEAVAGLQAAVARERAQARELQTELDRLKADATAREEAELSEQQKLQKENERLKAASAAALAEAKQVKWEAQATVALSNAGFSDPELSIKLLDPAAEDLTANITELATRAPGLLKAEQEAPTPPPPGVPAGLVPTAPATGEQSGTENSLAALFGALHHS